MRRAHGFTLIELTLAIALMSTMMVLTYNAVTHAVRVRAAVEERGKIVRAAQAFLDRLERELTAVYFVPAARGGGRGAQTTPPPAPTPTTGAAGAATDDTGGIVTTGIARTAFVGADAEEAGVPRDGLAFTCMCGEVWTFGLADTSRIPHTEVAYDFLYDPELEQTLLMRREDGSLDDRPTEGGFRDPVWEAVRGLNLRYLDPVDRQWKDSWDASGRAAQTALPRAIEITVWLGKVELDGDDVDEDASVILARTIELPPPATERVPGR